MRGLGSTIRPKLKGLLRPVFRLLRSLSPGLFRVRVMAATTPLAAAQAGPVLQGGAEEHEPVDPSTLEQPELGTLQTFAGYPDERVAEVLGIIRTHGGYPEADLVHDVVYVPWLHCLYSIDGRRLEASHERVESANVPAEIEVPRGLAEVKDQLVYVGPMSKHYGHFVTEGIGRLWYALQHPELPLLTHDLDRFTLRHAFIDAFFGASGLAPQRFVAFREPTLLRNVVLPRTSFMSSPRREVYAAHRLLLERVARRLLVDEPEQTAQPVYLSRRSVGARQRRIVGEDVLEREIEAAGFAIVRPEALGFREQILLINRHETIVGALGSALHTVLFDVSKKRRLVCFGYRDAPHPNYLMVDALKSVRSHYVAALDEDTDTTKDYSHRDRILDLDAALAELEGANLL